MGSGELVSNSLSLDTWPKLTRMPKAWLRSLVSHTPAVSPRAEEGRSVGLPLVFTSHYLTSSMMPSASLSLQSNIFQYYCLLVRSRVPRSTLLLLNQCVSCNTHPFVHMTEIVVGTFPEEARDFVLFITVPLRLSLPRSILQSNFDI